jgi:hypothetical protein
VKSVLTSGARVFVLLSGVVVGASVAPAAIADRVPSLTTAAESYKLPISPPRDQGDSDLCWVFATLSMLETNYRVRHPDSHVEFSRGAVQRYAIADRLRRFASGESRHLDDGGLAVEALALVRSDGLLADADYHDFIDSQPLYESLSRQLSASPELSLIDAALKPMPALTHLDDKPMAPAALAKAVLGDQTWSEYDLAADGETRVGPSSDPDARPETRVHYAPLPQLIGLIHASLKRGEAVVWGTKEHALLIFGADYDSDGAPLAYWVKDSEPPYIYRSPAADVHKVLTDVTVTDAPAATARE